jgi:arsenate reductase
MERKKNILFLCTGNSCRSQMAEGWTRTLKGDVFEPYSAGIEAHGLNPLAVKVMAETGVDISSHRSQLVSELMDITFDIVITVCDHARENCPVFLGSAGTVIHKGFDDPPKLAEKAATEDEVLRIYRRVRDEIRLFVKSLPESISENHSA